jgi:hypothetical protein
VNIDAGSVLSLAASTAAQEEIYSLDFGDLSIGHNKCLAGIAEEIAAYARNNSQALVFVEDSVDSAGSKWVVNADVEHVLLGDVPCYYTLDCDPERIIATVQAGESACLMNGFFIIRDRAELNPGQEIPTELARTLASGIHLILVESYDGTGYLLWKSPASDFVPSVYPL